MSLPAQQSYRGVTWLDEQLLTQVNANYNARLNLRC